MLTALIPPALTLTLSQGERECPSPRQRGRGRQAGQAGVEMALMLLPFLVTIFALIEFSFLFFTWVAMQHAAREGIRVAITGADINGTSPASDADRIFAIENRVFQSLTGVPRIDADVTTIVRSWSNATFTGSSTAADPGNACYAIEVEVEYVYRPMTPFFQDIVTLPLTTTERSINEAYTTCGS